MLPECLIYTINSIANQNIALAFLTKSYKFLSCSIIKNVYDMFLNMYHHYRDFNQLMTSMFIIIMLSKIDISKHYKSPHFSSFSWSKKNHSIKERGTITDLPVMYIYGDHVRTVKNSMSIYGSSRLTKLRKGGGGKKLKSL